MTRAKGAPPPPPRVDHLTKIVKHLVAHGPQTFQQLSDGLEIPLDVVRNAVARQRNMHPERLFRIVAWVPMKYGPCATYAYEPGPDVARPLNEKRDAYWAERRRERVAAARAEITISVPKSPYRTRFVNDINPWTLKRMAP